MKKHRPLARLALTTASALAGLGGTGAVLAQVSPFYFGVSQAFTHESNLFRGPDGTENSDLLSTTSLLAGFNQPVSRQRFFADARVRHNRFRDNDQLDNTGYGLNVGWDWETVESLSGTLNYSAYQTLASFSDNAGTAITTDANKERSQQFLARGKLGGTSLLALEAIYSHRKRDYSAAAFASAEFDQDSLSLGLQYQPSALLTLGAAVRGTKGRYPSALGTPGAFQADKFDRKDLDLTAVWTPTGLSKLAARLSYSDETHDQIKAREFSGATGALTWEYRPTGKLTFTTDLLRETGAEASFNGLSFSNANPSGDNAQLSSAIQVRARYEASAKITVDGIARYAERDLIPVGRDKTALLNLGVNWEPTRNWLLGCSVGHEKRGGNTPEHYDADIVNCAVQFMVR